MAKGITLKEAVANSENVRIRMFKSDFVEKMSHVHPAVPFILYIPIVAASIFFAFYTFHMTVGQFFAYLAIGLAIWSVVEYFLHRFIFHPPQTNEFLRKVYFYSHGIHHDAQDDATRLVMPPGASIPIAIGIYFATKAIWPEMHLAAFAGFVSGYLVYDFLHFATHFYAFKSRWFKFIKKNHMRHHNLCPDKNFGFTSPIWDIVFGSYYRVKSKA